MRGVQPLPNLLAGGIGQPQSELFTRAWVCWEAAAFGLDSSAKR